MCYAQSTVNPMNMSAASPKHNPTIVANAYNKCKKKKKTRYKVRWLNLTPCHSFRFEETLPVENWREGLINLPFLLTGSWTWPWTISVLYRQEEPVQGLCSKPKKSSFRTEDSGFQQVAMHSLKFEKLEDVPQVTTAKQSSIQLCFATLIRATSYTLSWKLTHPPARRILVTWLPAHTIAINLRNLL